jgi:hypothetical protein
MLLMVANGRAATPEPEGAEIWETGYLFSKAVAYVQRNGVEISGVLYVYGPFGQTDVYHFQGTAGDHGIQAAHYTGHRFEGRFVTDREVTGLVTTRNGYKLSITSRKRPADQSLP